MKKWASTITKWSVLFALVGLVGCKNQAKAATQKSDSSALHSDVQDPKKLYKIDKSKISLKMGQKGKAAFDIKLVSGAKIHPKAPFVCEVSSSAGLSVDKKQLGHPDAKSSRDKKTKLMTVNVATQVVAKHTGKQHVKMDCAFFVCTKDLCMRTEEKIKIAAKVQ